MSEHLQVLVVLGQGGVLRLLDVLLDLLLPLGVHGHLEQKQMVRFTKEKVQVPMTWKQHALVRNQQYVHFLTSTVLIVLIYLWGHKGRHGNKLKVGVTNQLPRRQVNVLAVQLLRQDQMLTLPATGKASQSCSLTWQRCHSTEGNRILALMN